MKTVDFEHRTDVMTKSHPTPSTGVMPLAMAFLLTTIAVDAGAQGNERSPFIDSVSVGSVWQDVTANEGNNLRIDYQTVAYSGGGTGNGRTVVFGGGHNNGMNDAVAFLDWRNFETVGWTEELISTADHIGVNDDDWREIGLHLNANYDGSTPGGISDARGLVALSRHTYDQIVVRSDHFYLFNGILPFDNPGQPNTPWGVDEGDIWRYDFGSGWTFIGAPLATGRDGHGAAALDTITGNIWVHDGRGLRLFDTTTETVSPPGDYLNSQVVESSLNFNPEKGAQGTLFGSGTYAGSNWHEYDIATGQQRNMGAVPGNARNTYIIYIDSTYGSNYGTYFAFVPQNGTLRRWNGNGWDTIATGAPSNNGYVYGRAGFEPIHQVFYWIHNPYSGNDAWQTHVVRPYPFNGSAEPAPSVSLSADPTSVPMQGNTTLTWNTSNATSCNASGDWTGSRPVSGSEVMGPLDSDKTYSLTCSGNGGTSADSATVTIDDGGTPAPTVTLSANPMAVSEGEFTVVDWTTANANTCSAMGDWTGQRALQGSESVGPLSSDAQFTLSCTGFGGNTSGSVSVTVSAAPPPPPPPPAPPPGGGTGVDTDKKLNIGAFGIPGILLLLGLVALRRSSFIH